jgi:hypothetical protein
MARADENDSTREILKPETQKRILYSEASEKSVLSGSRRESTPSFPRFFNEM